MSQSATTPQADSFEWLNDIFDQLPIDMDVLAEWVGVNAISPDSAIAAIIERIYARDAEVAKAARNYDLTPNEMLLAQNRRLIEAGDALYERASYTGRTFDGTHRLLSAAAKWLDVRGKNSGKYQAALCKTMPGGKNAQ